MDVGIGSREHDLLGEDDIIFRTFFYLQCRIFQEAHYQSHYQHLSYSLGCSKNPQDLSRSILSCHRNSWQINWIFQSYSLWDGNIFSFVLFNRLLQTFKSSLGSCWFYLIFKVVMFSCIQQIVIFIPLVTVKLSINGKFAFVVLALIFTFKSFFFS